MQQWMPAASCCTCWLDVTHTYTHFLICSGQLSWNDSIFFFFWNIPYHSTLSISFMAFITICHYSLYFLICLFSLPLPIELKPPGHPDLFSLAAAISHHLAQCLECGECAINICGIMNEQHHETWIYSISLHRNHLQETGANVLRKDKTHNLKF